MAQRLIRLLCTSCKEGYEAGEAELDLLGLDAAESPVRLYRAKGCSKCNNSGYRGRTGIYELIMMDDKLRNMIHEGLDEQAIVTYARTTSPGILDDGRQRIMSGDTTVEEVLRVTAA
jgi:general secretion pathway protein E